MDGLRMEEEEEYYLDLDKIIEENKIRKACIEFRDFLIKNDYYNRVADDEFSKKFENFLDTCFDHFKKRKPKDEYQLNSYSEIYRTVIKNFNKNGIKPNVPSILSTVLIYIRCHTWDEKTCDLLKTILDYRKEITPSEYSHIS